MEKLYKYLQHIGIEEKPKHGNYTPAPAEYYRETYGNDYFYNAPGITYPGAVVALDYEVEAPEEYFVNLCNIEKKIKTYCKKYGYSCRRKLYSYTATVYYYIEKQSDRDAAATYYFYADACSAECDEAAHILYKSGHPEKVNETLREIMQRWGAAYNERLKADEGSTAQKEGAA